MKKLIEEYGLIIVVMCLILLMLAFFCGDFSINTLNQAEGSVGKMNNITSNVDGHLTEKSNKTEYVSKSESQIGNYADVDGDGTVDGIIFADLAFDSDDEIYTMSERDELKNYYISQASYTNILGGTAKVVSAVEGTTGVDRFYVMALNDFDEELHSWYSSAYDPTMIYGIDDSDTITSYDFGYGKLNTTNIIDKWNTSAYGAQTSTDLWAKIQSQSNNGWFLPSQLEWWAFKYALNIETSNYSEKGLKDKYWSSNLYSFNSATYLDFGTGYSRPGIVSYSSSVRLATIF